MSTTSVIRQVSTTLEPIVNNLGQQAGQNNTGSFCSHDGYQAGMTNTYNYCYTFGRSAACTATNQFSWGSSSYPMDLQSYVSTSNLTPLGWAVTLNGASYTIELRSGTASFAVGAAAGSGATLSCTTNHVCSARSGTVTLVTAGTPAAGTLATITYGVTFGSAALPNCLISLSLASGTISYELDWVEGTTTIVVKTGNTLVTGTTYLLRYRC